MESVSKTWSSSSSSSGNFKSYNGNGKHFERRQYQGFDRQTTGFRGRGQRGRFGRNRGGGSGQHQRGHFEDRNGSTSANEVPVADKVPIDLVLSDDEEAGGHSLTVNKNYADRYDRWRRLEEVEKIKSRHGDIVGSDEDSSSSEDEDGNRLPPEFDKEFLRTLSCLKGKDPRIYDGRSKFFENIDVTNLKDAHAKKPKPEKPIYLRDYERQMLLTNEEGVPDEEKDNEKLKQELFVGNRTYMEEQKQIKESFKQVVNDSDEDDNLLTERKKTADEVNQEDDNYYTWLKGQKQHLETEEVEKDIGYLKEMWNKNSLPADEEFLRDFIVDKKYLNKDKTEDSDVGFVLNSSEEEETLEKMETFENKFNFRFEEPDQEFIKRYPRLLTTSLRIKDEKRKEQRNKTRDRKLKKKDQKREELKRLKAMKRKEIAEKLEKIKQITGNAKIGLEAADLDADFDPEAYDRRMKQMFDDEYYDCDAQGVEEDEEKPEFPPDAEDYDNWDEWQGGEEETEEAPNNEPHCEDPDFNMDCDYNPKANFQEEMMNASRKKRRKLNKLAKALQLKKPVFDPENKTFEEYFDEYYKLDYEDIIDDLPCRFKYRQVPENDFGLTVGEIFSAEDGELNAWCSLKKTCQHRTEQEELRDLDAYRQKSRSYWKKEKILKSVYAKDVEEAEVEKEESARKSVPQKKETGKSLPKQKAKDSRGEKPTKPVTKSHRKIERKVGKDRKFDSQGGNMYKGIDVGVTDSRLKAFGLNPKKFKDKLVYGTKDGKSQS